MLRQNRLLVQWKGAALLAGQKNTLRSSRRLIAALWLLNGCVIAGGTVSALWRGLGERPDWSEFVSESRYVFEHGRSAPGTAMFGYLPAVPVLLWPFTAWLPNSVGLPLFVASNVAALGLAVWALARWWTRFDCSGMALPLAIAICSVNLAQALQSNQLTMWTLGLMVCGLSLVCRGAEWRGGALLGTAVVIKTIPVLLAGYLLLTRRWKALLSLVGAAAAIDGGISLLAYGAEGAVREHREWLRRVAWHSSFVQMEDPFLRVHRHGSNQSFSAVMARWLREPPTQGTQVIVKGAAPAEEIERVRSGLREGEVLSLDPMPPREAEWEVLRKDIAWVPRLHVAAFSAAAVKGIWLVCLIGAAIGLVIFTWRQSRRDSNCWQPIAALWVLALFWPSPMMRDYYLAWALPAVVVIADAVVAVRLRSDVEPVRGRLIGGVALTCWVGSAACLGSRWAMWYGVHLVALAVLAAAVMWAWQINPNPSRQAVGWNDGRRA